MPARGGSFVGRLVFVRFSVPFASWENLTDRFREKVKDSNSCPGSLEVGPRELNNRGGHQTSCESCCGSEVGARPDHGALVRAA